MTRPTRRDLLRSAVACGAAAGPACLRRPAKPLVGGFVDRGFASGHRIRDGETPAPEGRERVPLVIVGGGVAGLSAAWRLRNLGFEDFIVLELEDRAGGNSRWGETAGAAYPWGAHYVPLPDRRIPLVEELFTELGVLRDGIWNSAHLARQPLQRLYKGGRWQPGLEPGLNAAVTDRDQFDRFWDRMDFFRQGGEFQIPIRVPEQTAPLDRMSMKAWLVGEGFFSSWLHWYVDYACRDDYGSSYDQTSAWAGIHYFAARPESDLGVLTWPEGNGWIVKRLLELVGDKVRTGAAVSRIEQTARGGLVVFGGRRIYETEAAVFAAPLFLAPYVMPEIARELPSLAAFTYSPWVVANLALEERPREGDGPDLAWENIIYGSGGLGYVNAGHQVASNPPVWTYYHALAGDPAGGRRGLLEQSWESCAGQVLAELQQAHPRLRERVARIDVMRYGHAMIRPIPGLISSAERRAIADLDGPLQFGASDVSGVSIFEEAQYRGVRAAERCLRRLGFGQLDYA